MNNEYFGLVIVAYIFLLSGSIFFIIGTAHTVKKYFYKMIKHFIKDLYKDKE